MSCAWFSESFNREWPGHNFVNGRVTTVVCWVTATSTAEPSNYFNGRGEITYNIGHNLNVTVLAREARGEGGAIDRCCGLAGSI